MYSVTGGVPKYIELFAESKDIYKEIERNVLNRSGYLYDEPNFLLQQEVSEVGSYFSVIKAIAAGNSKLSAIASMLEVKATSLTKYLKTLMDWIYWNEKSLSRKTTRKKVRKAFIKSKTITFGFGSLLSIQTAASLKVETAGL